MTTSDYVASLAEGFSGQILTPADRGYDDVRQVHNGLIDKRPALIARAELRRRDRRGHVGRDTGLEISVRGGGHNVAGKAVTDGGLMIDLSLMNDVRVDPTAMTITAGGGATWGELNAAAGTNTGSPPPGV